MGWRDNLLECSFRGVVFYYEDTKLEGGMRLVDHEFPLRDDAYVENLGKKNRKYSVAGYVLGDDYFSARDALLSALEEDGSGTLNHPYLGPLTVQVDAFTESEIREEGGAAKFEIIFLDAGSDPSPVSSLDTSNISSDAADALADQLETSFGDDWIIDGGSIGDAVDLLGTLVGVLAFLTGWPDINTSNVSVLIINLPNKVSSAAQIAGALLAFFEGYVAAVFASLVPFDESFSSRGPLLIEDPTYGLATLAAWGATLEEAIGTRQSANQAALVALVEGLAVVAMAKLYARTDFVAQEDADAARDLVTDFLDTLSLNAADIGDTSAYFALQALYQSASDDLTTRGHQLPSTVDVALNAAMPALALAQRFYTDATRAAELISRNYAPHPLFMPAIMEVLTA